MGFDDSAAVLTKLCNMSEKKACFDITNGETPEIAGLDVVCLDISSLGFQIFSGCTIGADVLNRLQFMVNEITKAFFPEVYVFCIDVRQFVTEAKKRERLIREQERLRRGIIPYGTEMTLCGGKKIDTLDYKFTTYTALPDSYDRVLATPQLLLRAFDFVCDLLTFTVELPASDKKRRFIINGCDQRPILGTAPQTRIVEFSGSGRSVPQMQKCESVGEGEGQCLYWARKLRTEEGKQRILVRANDSDAIAVALMTVRHFFDPESQKICGSLWVELISSATHRKCYDIITLWRGINRTMRQLPDSYKLHSPIETVLLACMLTGNDYCDRLPQLGPGTLLKQLPNWITELIQQNRDAVRVFPAEENMLVDELLVVALLARAYSNEKKVIQMMEPNIYNDRWLLQLDDQRKFFDKLADLTQDGRWKIGNRTVVIPGYLGIRAAVRRAFYSLHYYLTITVPGATFDAFRTVGRLSLFGHSQSGSDPKLAFTNIVAMYDENNVELQPFIHRREDSAASQDRKRVVSPEERDVLLQSTDSETARSKRARLKSPEFDGEIDYERGTFFTSTTTTKE